MRAKDFIVEGGNVFAGKTGPINRENIEPTLTRYFQELKQIFPNKSNIFNLDTFVPLGSVGKKEQSGDIDLGVDVSSILDQTLSDKSISQWGIDPKAVAAETEQLQKRARTSTPTQLRLKAFFKLLTLYINQNAKHLYTDEKKVNAGNIFGLYPQYTESGKEVGIGVQIDWMVGNLDWLRFSYYSSEYPKGSNVKGLHRTQLMLSAFQLAGLSFDHVGGIKDKDTREVIATNPKDALTELSTRLKLPFTEEVVENYYSLHKLLQKLPKQQYDTVIKIYLNILDSTRCDIPDDLQSTWIERKDELGLTGKFLPDNSKLKEYV